MQCGPAAPSPAALPGQTGGGADGASVRDLGGHVDVVTARAPDSDGNADETMSYASPVKLSVLPGSFETETPSGRRSFNSFGWGGSGASGRRRGSISSGGTLSCESTTSIQRGLRRLSAMVRSSIPNDPVRRSHTSEIQNVAQSVSGQGSNFFAVAADVRAEIPKNRVSALLHAPLPPEHAIKGALNRRGSPRCSPRLGAQKLWRQSSALSRTSACEWRCSNLRLWLSGECAGHLLRLLALFCSILAPFHFSMEGYCHLPAERNAAHTSKVALLAFSLCYTSLSLGRAWALYDLHVFARRLLAPLRSLRGGELRDETNKHCLKLRLCLDLLVLPSLLGEVVHVLGPPPSGLLPSFSQWVVLTGLVRIWRLVNPEADTPNMRVGFWMQVMELLLLLGLFTHVGACGFGLVASVGSSNGHPTWADGVMDSGESCYAFYMSSLYFTAYTVTSIGYGDIVPATATEQGITACFMIASQIYLAKIFADLTFITSTHNYWSAEHTRHVTWTATALTSMGVPSELRERVAAFQDFAWEAQKVRQTQQCLNELSQPLRDELQLTRYNEFVMQAPFLRQLPVKAIRSIVNSLTDCLFLPADFIMRRGDEGSELYFMRDGCAAVFSGNATPQWDDQAVCVLGPGDYFGEIALLSGAPRTSWVMAQSYVACCVLPKLAIDEAIAMDERCLLVLVRSMKKSLSIRPQTMWSEVALRLHKEFKNLRHLQQFLFKKGPGEPEGTGDPGCAEVKWFRFEEFMARLEVDMLDAKLLWVEAEPLGDTTVSFRDLVGIIHSGCDSVPVEWQLEGIDSQPPGPKEVTPQGNCRRQGRTLSAQSRGRGRSKSRGSGSDCGHGRAGTHASDQRHCIAQLEAQIQDLRRQMLALPDQVAAALQGETRLRSASGEVSIGALQAFSPGPPPRSPPAAVSCEAPPLLPQDDE